MANPIHVQSLSFWIESSQDRLLWQALYSFSRKRRCMRWWGRLLSPWFGDFAAIMFGIIDDQMKNHRATDMRLCLDHGGQGTSRRLRSSAQHSARLASIARCIPAPSHQVSRPSDTSSAALHSASIAAQSSDLRYTLTSDISSGA
jgi:hypothetical protein